MKILLVDLSAVFWRAYHATKDQQVNEAFQITVNTINARRHQYDHCAVCCDHAPYKRKDISAEYKAQRDVPDPIAVGQLRRVKERLEQDGVLLWDAEGYESDDLIATACATLTKDTGDESDLAVDILTCDKDLYSLITERVTIVRLDSGERHGPEQCKEKLGVEPWQVPELLALTGDKSDNVPGIPGVGPKKALQLLTDNGSLHEWYADKSIDIKGPPAVVQAFAANRENVRLSLELVTLMTDAPIDVNQLFETREQKPLGADIKDEEFEEMETTEQVTDTTPANDTPLPPVQQSIELAPQQAPGLAKAEPTAFLPFEVSLEPKTMGQAWALAKAIHSSRLFQCESPDQALVILMTGRELGLSAMTSMRGFHFVKGRPVMSAQLMIALILKSGKAQYFERSESSDKTATFITKRVGSDREQKKTFTLDDAKLAQLVKSDGNWAKYPGTMCEWRAAAQLARLVYPDLLMGVYLPDEMDEAA